MLRRLLVVGGRRPLPGNDAAICLRATTTTTIEPGRFTIDTDTVVVIATELSAACLTRLQGWIKTVETQRGTSATPGADEVSNRDSCLFIRRPWNFSILPWSGEPSLSDH